MIKNLLFDLGGVIMDIRRENCVAAFRQLGMEDPNAFLGEYVQKGPFEGIESGRLNEAEFHSAIREIMGDTEVTDAQIDEAFGKFLVGIPHHRLEELTALHGRYRMYLLSNTNPIMWVDGIRKAFAQEGKDENYYFDGLVRSYEAKAMKPAPGIFEYAIKHLGIEPEETLFLDDSQANLDAAAKFGFKTLLVAPGTEFYELLKEYPGIEL